MHRYAKNMVEVKVQQDQVTQQRLLRRQWAEPCRVAIHCTDNQQPQRVGRQQS